MGNSRSTSTPFLALESPARLAEVPPPPLRRSEIRLGRNKRSAGLREAALVQGVTGCAPSRFFRPPAPSLRESLARDPLCRFAEQRDALRRELHGGEE